MWLMNKINSKFQKNGLLNEVAAADQFNGRQLFAEHPSVGLSPQKLANILKEAESGDPATYLALAEDMEEKDPHYNAVLGTRKRQVSQLELSVVAASESVQDERNADLIKQFIDRGELQEEMFNILDAIGKGFSVTEIMWEMSETKWVIKSLEHRDPRWFDFHPDNRRDIMIKTGDGLTPISDHPYKFVTFISKAKTGIPIRGGIARLAAWGYIFKNFDIKSWVQFLEIYGQPYRVGRYHGQASDREKNILLRAVKQIGRDAAAVIPANMSMEFIEAKMSGNAALFKDLANYLDYQISKAVLGQTTTTDAVSGGHAVSKEHNEVRQDIERSDANMLQVVLRRDIVKPLIDVNFGPQKAYPKILIGRADETDLKEFSQTVKILSDAGLKISRKQIYEKTGLMPPEDDDDILGGGEIKEVLNDKVTDKEADKKAVLSRGRENGTTDEIDSLAQLMAIEAKKIVPKISAGIEEILENSTDFDDFKIKLLAQADKINIDELADLMARGNFQARLAGKIMSDGNGV